jgi:hypothetical protein
VTATSSGAASDGSDANPARPTPDEADDEGERAANARLDALVDDLNALDL